MGQETAAHKPDEETTDVGTVDDGETRPMLSTLHQDLTLPDDVVEIEGHTDEQEDAETHFSALLFEDAKAPRAVSLKDVPKLIQDDRNFVWLDLSQYDPPDLERVARSLQLNRIGLHTVQSQWHRPTLDVFTDHFLVSVTVARLDAGSYRIHAGQLDLFVGNNFLVSTHKLELPFYSQIMARTEHNPELFQNDSAYMLYVILDQLLEYYERLVESVQHEIESIEEQALISDSDSFLHGLLQVKRYVFALGQLVEQHRQVFEAFLRPDFPFVGGEDVDVYFRDLQARLARLVDRLVAARDGVTGAFDIYVSQMSHRTNNIIKILTMVSVVLFPISVLTAFFGTNFPSMNGIYSRNGFFVMLSLIALTVAVALFTFRRRRWI